MPAQRDVNPQPKSALPQWRAQHRSMQYGGAVVSTPLWPEELVSTGTEREVLEAFLDCQRRQIKAKIAGVSEADARRRIVPSMTTLAGLIKHLAAVERNWFQRQLAQRDPADIPGNSRGDDQSWELGPDDTLDSLIAEYDTVCEESRRIAAGFMGGFSYPEALSCPASHGGGRRRLPPYHH
ncbi:DinB family protein [Nonomuraea sp. B12E4]|uniref:DinB family protein n=1 Tax=Nonomuraea sp. B12E4 TaxID=3153564 RepID=UPI00325CE92B